MLKLYRFLVNFFFPLVTIIIFLRTFFYKEDKVRYKEKLFASSLNILKKSEKKLIWFHAASIGEIKSIVPLIKKFDNEGSYEFLITTQTLSSAGLIKKIFNKQNIIHRFFPIDRPKLIKIFLDGWSPSIAIFVESEIWPNFINQIKIKKIPLILLNARITKKTFLKWNTVPKTAKEIFSNFDLCLSSSIQTQEYLQKLNVKNIKYLGNLKLAGEVIVNNKVPIINNDLNKRFFWCALSTHNKENLFCLNVHRILKNTFSNLTTIIIPRHINKVKSVQSVCKKLNLENQILSNDEKIDEKKDIIIINSYGNTSKYLKLCKSVFIGKSLIKKLEKVAGQNPIEAAKLGCKIYSGPYIYNFQEIYELLKKNDISEIINSENELSNKISIDFKTTSKDKDTKIKIINDLGDKILVDTHAEVNKILIK